ncbi:MAG: SGNH/GDSL hydrolase family protein [Armatimonadota bacterium]
MRTLNENEIMSCARGALQARQTELGLLPLRFTDAELAYYEGLSEAASVRAHCPAGIALDFFTNSDVVEIEAGIGAAARLSAFFDVYVDGVFVGSIGAAQPGETVKGAVRWTAPADRPSRVTIYLPHMRVTGLKRVALAEGSSFTPAPPERLLLALGDSITQGMEAPNPSLAFPTVAARALGLFAHNCGIGGQRFDASALPERALDDPAQIIVAYGANDWWYGDSADTAGPYLARLRELYPQTRIAVLEPIWSVPGDGDGSPPESACEAFADYRRSLAAVVNEYPGIECIPSERLLPPAPAFVPDGLHPDDAGHVVYGLNLARLLRT